MWTTSTSTSKLNEINLHACIQTICGHNRTQQLALTACLHWQSFTERAPACSILSCHFHKVCSLRFQPSHCVLLNPSSQRYAAWRTATVSLPILQHVGSVGGAGGLHSGMAPGEEEAGGGHIACHYLHYTWERKSYEGN